MCIGLAWLSLSCTEKKEHYVIGVSQCSQDIWRNKLNDELLMGTYFHDDVELRFASADDSDERQIAQVDSLVAQGIDLLIVAPNQVGTLSSAIDRAFDKGIPVIVFDRKTDSQKFTAYIGAEVHQNLVIGYADHGSGHHITYVYTAERCVDLLLEISHGLLGSLRRLCCGCVLHFIRHVAVPPF